MSRLTKFALRPVRKAAVQAFDFLVSRAQRQTRLPWQEHLAALGTSDKQAQILLLLRYQQMARAGEPLPALEDVGFQVFSQTDEDGILLFLFAVLGTTNRRCVEISAGTGIQCNCANLIINHGWDGLLFDGSDALISQGRAFYAACLSTHIAPPALVSAWINRDNINALIAAQGFTGEIDLLSLDIDGNDYWLWQAIDSIKPRVVVAEGHIWCGPNQAVSMPYNAQFSTPDFVHYNFGASLAAFVKLGRAKGYRLVGTNTLGFNAFFVRNDVGTDNMPELSLDSLFARPRFALYQDFVPPEGWEEQWQKV